MSVQKLLQILGFGRSPKRVPVVMRTDHGWDLVFSSPQDVYGHLGQGTTQDWRRILPIALTALMVLFIATHIPVGSPRNSVHSGVLGAQTGPQHVLPPVATPSATPTPSPSATPSPTPTPIATATPAPAAPLHFDTTLTGSYTINNGSANTSCQNGSAGNAECQWLVTVTSGNLLNVATTWDSSATVELRVILPDGTVRFSQTDATKSIATSINNLPAKSVITVIVHDAVTTNFKLRLSN